MSDPVIRWECPFCHVEQARVQSYLLAGVPGLPEWMQPRAALRALKLTHIMNYHVNNRDAREMIITLGDEANTDFKRALYGIMKSP